MGFLRSKLDGRRIKPSTRNHSWVIRRFLNRRWWTLFLVHANGVAVLAGKFVQGAGFGLIGDIAIGIVGAFIGDWLLPQIGIHLGTGIVSAIVNATPLGT